MKKLKLFVCLSALFWASGCSLDPMEPQDNLPPSAATETRSDDYFSTYDLALALIDHERSTLTTQQISDFCLELSGMMAIYPYLGPLMEYLYERTQATNFKLVLNIDSSINGRARFKLGDSYNTISFKSGEEIHGDNILEEIIHAAQFWLYGYRVMGESTKNIEFEAKLFMDIMYYQNSNNTNRLLWNINNSNGDIDSFQFVELYYSEFFTQICGNSVQRSFALDNFNFYVNVWGGEPLASYNPDFWPDMLGRFYINQ